MHFLLSVGVCLLCCARCLGVAFFPTNSAYGIFAAIAVPLDLPHRNVFVSYNFEANYNLPYRWDIPPVAYGIEEEDLFDEARHIESEGCTNCTTTSSPTTKTTDKPMQNSTKAESRRRRSLLTRTHFYHILMDKFQRSGYSGESCLLRLICETNVSGLGEINGVLGTLIHIMFSPSTSSNEQLPLPYYQAEVDGVHDQCYQYANECQENIIDLISAPLHEIVNSLTNNK